MGELIAINCESENPTVSGRDLHEFLEIGTEYMKWFERMAEYGFAENRDYAVFVKNDDNPLGGRPATDHALTLDMAKEISMIQRNDRGKQARQYFIEAEKRYRAQAAPELPADYLSALKALVASEEGKIRLLAENAAQAALIEEQRPKAEFFDAVTETCAECERSSHAGHANRYADAIDMGRAAKVLDMGVGRNGLFNFLRDKGVLMPDNIPYQQFIDRGHFRTIEQRYNRSDGSTHINIKTIVYQKGLDYIRRLWQRERDPLIADADEA